MLRLAWLTLRDRVFVLIGSLVALTLGSAFTIAAVDVMVAAQAVGVSGHSSHDQVLAAAAGGYLLGLSTVLVGFVAVFVVASIASLGATLRRRELALLRTVGATPGQIRRLVLLEAVLLALVGGTAGTIAAPVFARLLVAWLAARDMVPTGLHLTISPAAIPVGCLFMVCVSVAGTWPTARRCARVRPTEALVDASVDRGSMTWARWVCGAPCVLLAIGLVVGTAARDGQAQLADTSVVAVLAVSGLAMLAPAVVPRLCALGLLVVPGRAVSRLARWHCRVAVRRTAALAAPVLLVVGLVASLGTVIDSAQAGVVAHVTDPTDSSNMNPAFLAMVVAITLAYVAVCLGGIAAMTTSARSAELVTLRHAGATRAQVLGVVTVEALVATGIGAGLGVASFAIAGVGALVHGPAAGGGAPVVIPWGLIGGVTAVCAAVAVIVAAIVAERGPAGAGHLTTGSALA